MSFLREARAEAGMTLQEMSSKSGLALDTVSRLERGYHVPQATTIKKLSVALGVPVLDLEARLKDDSAPTVSADDSVPTVWENDDAVIKEWGEVLRRLRKEANMSQAELAFKSGLVPDVVSRLECGKRRPQLLTLKKISVALGISLLDLVAQLELHRVDAFRR